MEQLVKLVSPVLGRRCTETLLVQFKPDLVCLRLAVSKALGVAIIGGAAIVKVPQLVKLLGARSAEGVSFLGYLLETVALLIAFAYNWQKGHAFITYGETALLAAQNGIILALLAFFGGHVAICSLFYVLVAACLAYLPQAPAPLLASLQALTLPLAVLSKLPQIITLWRTGHAGQISLPTVLLQAAGSLARVYTSSQEVADPLVFAGCSLAALLNCIIALQVIFGKRKQRKVPKAASKPVKRK